MHIRAVGAVEWRMPNTSTSVTNDALLPGLFATLVANDPDGSIRSDWLTALVTLSDDSSGFDLPTRLQAIALLVDQGAPVTAQHLALIIKQHSLPLLNVLVDGLARNDDRWHRRDTGHTGWQKNWG